MGFTLALLGCSSWETPGPWLWCHQSQPPAPSSPSRPGETGPCHQRFHAPALLEQQALMNASVTRIFLQAQLLCYHPQPPLPAQAGIPHPSQVSVVPDAPPTPFSAALTIYPGSHEGTGSQRLPSVLLHDFHTSMYRITPFKASLNRAKALYSEVQFLGDPVR